MSVSDVWDVPCARQRVEFDHRSYLEGGVKDFPLAPLSLKRCGCQQGIIIITLLFNHAGVFLSFGTTGISAQTRQQRQPSLPSGEALCTTVPECGSCSVATPSRFAIAGPCLGARDRWRLGRCGEQRQAEQHHQVEALRLLAAAIHG